MGKYSPQARVHPDIIKGAKKRGISVSAYTKMINDEFELNDKIKREALKKIKNGKDFKFF